MTNFRPVSSGRFFTSHSPLSWISPSNGSLLLSNAARKSAGTGSPSGQNAPVVVDESNTIPSTSAGSHARVLDGLADSQDGPRADRLLRVAVPAPQRRRMRDTDSSDLAPVRPYAKTIGIPEQPLSRRVNSWSRHLPYPFTRSSPVSITIERRAIRKPAAQSQEPPGRPASPHLASEPGTASTGNAATGIVQVEDGTAERLIRLRSHRRSKYARPACPHPPCLGRVSSGRIGRPRGPSSSLHHRCSIHGSNSGLHPVQ